MAKKNVIKSIYTDLVLAVAQVIDAKYIYLGGRPDAIQKDSKIGKFVAIELPVAIEDIAHGNRKFVLNTTGVIYVFVKGKKDTTLDINSTDLVDDIVDLFPFNGEVCGTANPSVIMRGSDGYGYQVTTITFDLQTKPNIFNV